MLLPPLRLGLYLRPMSTVLAEILGDDSLISGLSCVRISLDYMKLCGRYGQKRAKNGEKRIRLVIRYGFYLRPLGTVLAEILGDNRPISWLSCVRISLDCFEARGSSVWKCVKKAPKIDDLFVQRCALRAIDQLLVFIWCNFSVNFDHLFQPLHGPTILQPILETRSFTHSSYIWKS